MGSSNFTYPGLTQNVELNVQVVQHHVELLQQWYEQHWNEAEEVTPEILKIIERHTRDYTPFEVYARSLQEYFRRYELSAGEWERHTSRVYPMLARYQQEGYQQMLKIAQMHGGAFLWNPVRLMQRIGRVDRRMNPAIEARIVADHPEQKSLRGEVAYWNFLPPDELDDLLKLYRTVTKKTLRISKTFGIEGRKLLKPEDDYDDLRDFYEAYEGTTSPTENLRLEWQQLLKDHPGLEQRLNQLPLRVFSGKQSQSPEARAVFFCYALPAPTSQVEATTAAENVEWTEEAGSTRWYLYRLDDGQIIEEVAEIADYIRSTPDTLRQCNLTNETLTEIRSKVERHIKNGYLKRMQATVGVKPVLKAWMEIA